MEFKKNIVQYVFFLWFLLFITLHSFNTSAQEISDFKKEAFLEQNVENITESHSENALDYTLVFDELLQFLENPLDLNRAKKEDLEKLIVLNETQINNLLKHIETNGKLIVLEELQSIDGFDLTTIEKIIPYVKINTEIVNTKFSINEVIKNGQNQLFIRHFQKNSGIDSLYQSTNTTSNYLGDKNSLFARYRFNYGNDISLGFTAEKDPGEQFFKGSQSKGFDFYSAHLFIKNAGKLKTLALGDYQAQFGQGLCFYSGFGFGKSSNIMNIKRNANVIKPYTSVDENRFLRGAAATFGFKSIELTTFFSRKKIDANINSYEDSVNYIDEKLPQETDFVSAFEQTGLHRTQLENNRRKTLSEKIYGTHIAYKKRNFNFGGTFSSTQYGIILNRDLTPYNQFEFNGSENNNLGIDHQFLVGNYNFFGEISRSKNGSLAINNGVLISLDRKLLFVMHYRNYSRGYQSLYANAISENLKPANEKGIYLGINAGPFKKITITAYFDRFNFTWLKYQVNGSSHGKDALIQINYTPSKKIDMYGRIRLRDKLKNTTEDIDEIDYLISNNQLNFRYNISFEISPSIKLRNRVELVTYNLENKEKENGYLIFQDVIYNSLKHPFSFAFRYALFDTDSYNSRIYAFENDVASSFTIPSYYYRGNRTYITLKYKPNKKTELGIRCSKSTFDNQKENKSYVGNEIQNLSSDFKIQLKLTF